MKLTFPQKMKLAVAVAACIGMIFWIRALASWRPQTVAKVGFDSAQLRFSRDGQFLLIETHFRDKGAILHLENVSIDSQLEHIRNFDKNHELETFPRVWLDETDWQLYFSPTRNRNIALSGAEENEGLAFFSTGEESSRIAWSKQRREVYYEFDGEIWIWNWDDGKLKRRVRYAKSGRPEINARFSPDQKWLLSFETLPDGNGFLRCYDVQNGKMIKIIHQTTDMSSFGFSPDGRWFWFVQDVGNWEFNLLRADNWKWQWSAKCAEPVKWLPDGRIGIVQENGFQWRLASGREFRQLPGPSGGISNWALSPDGNWIYSCEQSGIIRRWRAR